MHKQVLFIQGAGEGAYEEDHRLVERFRRALGQEYEIDYPAMPNEDDPRYDEWAMSIEKELALMHGPIILVGHSLGGSVLLKWLSENKAEKPIAGIFVMAAPFWGGEGWRYEGYEQLELPKDFAATALGKVPVFLYHCQDDAFVPSEHLGLYEKLLPQASVRLSSQGGHQFNDALDLAVKDIKSLA